jgi:hypothetical protein
VHRADESRRRRIAALETKGSQVGKPPAIAANRRSVVVVPLIVGCSQFMHQFSGAVITTALPQMASSLGENPLRLNLAITCYLLALAIFVPIRGGMG